MPIIELTDSEIEKLAESVCKRIGDTLVPKLLEALRGKEAADAVSYMTVEEVAEKLQISPRQINSYCRQLTFMLRASKKPLDLPISKAGKSYRVDASQFDKAVRCGLFSPNPRLDAFIKTK